MNQAGDRAFCRRGLVGPAAAREQGPDSSMETNLQPVVVIAAAGHAKRFGGEQKVLAPVGGQPSICRVAATCRQALGPHREIVVIGHRGPEVRTALGEAPYRTYVTQQEPLGTGDALRTAMQQLEPAPRQVLFLCGDKPLLSPASLRMLWESAVQSSAGMVFLTGCLQGDPTPSRQGRVLVIDPDEVLAIVERATIDALAPGEKLCFAGASSSRREYSRAELLQQRRVNISAYAWPEAVLRASLGKLALHPEKGEYFVTDLVQIIREAGYPVRALPAGTGEGLGIDTPDQLLIAEQAWQRRQQAVAGQGGADALR